jgi:hypothetical protein
MLIMLVELAKSGGGRATWLKLNACIISRDFE